MADILQASNNRDGSFAITLPGVRLQHWSPSQLLNYLTHSGYSDDDAAAIVHEAAKSHTIEILIPDGPEPWAVAGLRA